MRKYIKILLILVSAASKAQSNQIITYDTLPCYKDYNGEWLYANGQDTVRFFITTQRVVESSNLVCDWVVAWHEYKQGNNIIETRCYNKATNLPIDGNDPTYDSASAIFSPHKFNGYLYCDTLFGYIHDFSANKDYKRFGIYASNNRKKLHVFKCGGIFDYIQPTIPDVFDLIKQ